MITAASPLSIATPSLPGGTRGASYQWSLAANGGFEPYSWSIVSGSLPAGLTLDASGDISGTPTSTGTSTFTVKATDGATPTPNSVTGVFSIVIVAPPVLTITTTSLYPGSEGQNYGLFLEATGGVGPYTWSTTSGTLPAGLSLTSAGYLLGVPTATGTSSFTVEVTDSATPTPSTANELLDLTVGPATPLTIVGSPNAGTQGQPYQSLLQATGGFQPVTWSLASGALPAGLSLEPYGGITGTPLEVGTFGFTATAVDAATPTPHVATRALSITISPALALSITTTELPGAVQGQPYQSSLGATGGVGPYTWVLTAGSLPAGITLGSDGEIAGTPSGTVGSTFTVEAIDAETPGAKVATETLQIAVTAAPPLSIGTTGLPGATQAESYSVSLFAAGGFSPLTWSLASGSLPAGLALSADGLVSGVPSETGTSEFTVEVTDSASPSPDVAKESLSITTGPEATLAVTSTIAPSETQGLNTAFQLSATGGFAPYTWSLISGTLPTGETLSSTGTISGIPAASGTYSFTIQAADASTPNPETATRALSVVVTPAVPLVIYTTNLPAGTENQPYDSFLLATGGFQPYTWSILSGSLPGGLSLDAGGVIYGTPTTTGTFSFTTQVADSRTSSPEMATETISLVIGATPSFSITSTGLSSATQGQAYGDVLSAVGGTAPFTWSLLSGSLPAGLKLTPAGDIVGIPSTAGTSNLSIGVTDSSFPTPETSTATFKLIVNTPLLNLSPESLPVGHAGTPYSASLTATGGTTPYHWSIISGTLPEGLSINPTTGSITGTPTTAGATDTFTASISDSSLPQPETSAAVMSISVAPSQLTISTQSLAPATAGVAYDGILSASGGTAPYTWSIASGSLPQGLTVDANGDIIGTPTVAGTVDITAEVTDSSNPTPLTATEQLPLTVRPAPSLAIATSRLPGATQGEPYYAQLLVTGGTGPYTWTLLSGTLPTGLSLDANGAVSGVATSIGDSNFVLGVTDSASTPDSALVSLSLVVAANGPQVKLEASSTEGVAPLATNLIVTASQEAGDPLTYSADFGDGSAPETGTITAPYSPLSLAHTYAQPGSYLAEVSVVDSVSDLSTAGGVEITATNAATQPPTASLSLAPASGVAPFDAAMTVDGSDPSHLPLTYSLDFGDGSSPSSGALNGDTLVNHSYPTPGSYAVVLVVSNGQLSTTKSATVQVVPAIPVAANAGDDQVVDVGDTVSFDGSGSQPAGAINSYSWNFGDGTDGSGVDAQHVYAAAGTYTATLTVSSGQTSSSSSVTITVDAAPTDTGLQIGVTGGGVPLSGAEALILQANGQQVTALTNAQGVATLHNLDDGTYTVDVYQSGFEPGTVSAVVSGGVGSATIDLTAGAVASATVTATQLTLAQIIAAGINPDAAGNSVVIQFAANLNFGTFSVVLDGDICGDVFCQSSGGGGGGSMNGCAGSICYSVSPNEVDNEPTLDWIIVPGTASFLKQFFNVQMVVQNLAPSGFDLSQGSATLQIPTGISLAPTPTPQQMTEPMAAIAGGSSATASWIVRGDTEGSYNLTADYSSLLEPFGAPVSLQAVSASPLKIWGASAVTMTVDADATASEDYPYNVRIGLTNVADIPIYNAAIQLPDSPGSNFIYQPQQQLSYGTSVIEPGQTFYTPYFILIPQLSGTLNLSQSFIEEVAGDSSTAGTVVSHPTIDPPDTAPTLTATPELDAVGLQWAPVTGATSYMIYSTSSPSVAFGATPIDTVDAGTTQYLVSGVDASTPEWFAISSMIDGTPTMMHPLVTGEGASTSQEPVVNISLSGNGCGTSAVSATGTVSDTFGQLSGWSYSLGNNAPTTQSFSGSSNTQQIAFSIPAADIPADGTTLTVQATDNLGTGPPFTAQLGGCPAVESVDPVLDVGNPTIVIHGHGFGLTAASDFTNLYTNGDSPYFQMTDVNANWEDGGYEMDGTADPCTAIIGYWSDTEIIVSPQINQGIGHSCNLTPGDVLKLSIQPNGASSSTAPLTISTTVVDPSTFAVTPQRPPRPAVGA